jgi:hypothetical protein
MGKARAWRMHQCLTRRCWTCMRTGINEPASSALDDSPVVDVRGTRSGLRVDIDTRACIWVAVYLAVRVWGCSWRVKQRRMRREARCLCPFVGLGVRCGSCKERRRRRKNGTNR